MSDKEQRKPPGHRARPNPSVGGVTGRAISTKHGPPRQRRPLRQRQGQVTPQAAASGGPGLPRVDGPPLAQVPPEGEGFPSYGQPAHRGCSSVLVVGGVVLYLFAHVMNKVVKFLRHFAILFRFLAGHPLDGTHRHNGTFWQHPTKALHPTADKSWWHWRPGWHRAAMRLGGLLFVAVVGAGLWFATTLTLIVFAVLARSSALVLRPRHGPTCGSAVTSTTGRGNARCTVPSRPCSAGRPPAWPSSPTARP